MTLDAFLLTRQWRDTAKGVELSFWATSGRGAVKVVIEAQQSVCFVQRSVQLPLPASVQRKPRALQLLHHGPVDALYFSQQKTLQQLRQSDVPLCESDIKPTDRYLMERFIKASFSIHGELQQCEGYLKAVNPHLTPSDYTPVLKTVSMDIETRGNSQQLYSIAAASASLTDVANCKQSKKTVNTSNTSTAPPDDIVFMIGKEQPQVRNGYTLWFYPTERDLLAAFLHWIQLKDPDILTGWAVVNFDLNFLNRKCRSLGIPFLLGRAGEQAAVLQPGNSGAPRIARIPGRAVLDGIDQLKAAFWSFSSFSLDNVSNELLGTGKLINSSQDKVGTINHLFKHNKPQLADYNHRDCTLVNEIFAKAQLLPFAIQRANLTGLALDRLGGSVAAFDNLYLPKLHRHGFVAPDVRPHTGDVGSPGGYVMDSKPGLYKHVLVLDFKSLYPSIIRTFFIDPLGLAVPGKNPVPGFVDAFFSREQHILPGVIESLWAARDEAKLERNGPLSQAIKIIMNSFYGVLGTTGCRFYSQQLASSITRRGHEIILQSREWIQSQGYEVIYGDTDSVFVWLGEQSQASDGNAVGNTLTKGLNNWWQQELLKRYNLQSQLEVEFETHYLRFFMPTVRGMPTGSKKRYAGLCASALCDQRPLSIDDATLVVKGLEAARTDWTPLARSFQKELFKRVFHDQPIEEFVRSIAIKLTDGELDDQLVYKKRIRRALSEYQRNVPPHIRAARKLGNAGNSISYVITRSGPEPVEAQTSAIDYQHYLDKQLAPAADGILQFLDTSFAAITDAQMQMF